MLLAPVASGTRSNCRCERYSPTGRSAGLRNRMRMVWPRPGASTTAAANNATRRSANCSPGKGGSAAVNSPVSFMRRFTRWTRYVVLSWPLLISSSWAARWFFSNTTRVGNNMRSADAGNAASSSQRPTSQLKPVRTRRSQRIEKHAMTAAANRIPDVDGNMAGLLRVANVRSGRLTGRDARLEVMDWGRWTTVSGDVDRDVKATAVTATCLVAAYTERGAYRQSQSRQ